MPGITVSENIKIIDIRFHSSFRKLAVCCVLMIKNWLVMVRYDSGKKKNHIHIGDWETAIEWVSWWMNVCLPRWVSARSINSILQGDCKERDVCIFLENYWMWLWMCLCVFCLLNVHLYPKAVISRRKRQNIAIARWWCWFCDYEQLEKDIINKNKKWDQNCLCIVNVVFIVVFFRVCLCLSPVLSIKGILNPLSFPCWNAQLLSGFYVWLCIFYSLEDIKQANYFKWWRSVK